MGRESSLRTLWSERLEQEQDGAWESQALHHRAQNDLVSSLSVIRRASATSGRYRPYHKSPQPTANRV